jgi:hypothetical protein
MTKIELFPGCEDVLSPGPFMSGLLAQGFAEKHVEVVDAVLALHGIAAPIVSGGLQAALHGFANVHVFLLSPCR